MMIKVRVCNWGLILEDWDFGISNVDWEVNVKQLLLCHSQIKLIIMMIKVRVCNWGLRLEDWEFGISYVDLEFRQDLG